MKYPDVEAKTALVTGCSTGIGLATARMLRARGWHVFPTARKEDDLERLRSDGFTPIRLDVADAPSIRAAAEEVVRMAESGLGALVNNAGFGQPGAVEDLTRDVLRYQFEVNLFGLQDLTNRLMPTFRKQGYGRIVNVSSVLGRITMPFMGAYCASKHALESLSDAMRIELRGTGIAVVLVEPGPINTSFGENARERAHSQVKAVNSAFSDHYRKRLENNEPGRKASDAFSKPPEAVAVKILHALESPRPKRRYCVTAVAHFGAWMSRLAPAALMDWMMGKGLR